MRLTARSTEGDTLETAWVPVTRLASCIFDVRDFECFSEQEAGFCGSVEVEVFSEHKPLYNFPAISIFYEDSNSSSVVHSCIRTYNIDENVNDYAIGFPQTGFDVNFGEARTNYFCFIGGGQTNYKLNLTLETESNTSESALVVDNLRYGQLHVFFVEDLFKSLPGSGRGKLSIGHDLDVFPRFYAGTVAGDNVPMLTHSFFDTSYKYVLETESNAALFRGKNVDPDLYYDSAFMVPVLPNEDYRTEIRFYGQNLEFEGKIDLKVYTLSGEKVGSETLVGECQKRWLGLGGYSVSELIDELGLDDSMTYGLFVGFESEGSTFPKRFKLGLNVSKRLGSPLGTNICFAPLVQGELTLNKPYSRRWFPVGGKKNYIGSLHFTKFSKEISQACNHVTLEFRNTKGEALIRDADARGNATLIIDVEKDQELQGFLSEDVGWCFASADSYLVDSYFLSTNAEQIGGDHAF